MKSQMQRNTCEVHDEKSASGSSGVRHAHWSGLPFLALVVAGLLGAAAPRAATAKSLYVIASIYAVEEQNPIYAYDIGPDGKLTYQAECLVPSYGIGAVGLALDSKSEHLFITFENSNVITLLNATTMEVAGTATAAGAVNLAGIVYDQGRELLYCMDRYKPTLYVYRWDSSGTGLTPVPGAPFRLSGAQAFGIALDGIKGELYVGGTAPAVHVYSTLDWRLIRTIPVRRVAISVAVDPVRNFLYYGGNYPTTDNFYLSRYDLVSGEEKETSVSPTAGVMGLGVDPETGFVYISTGRNNETGGDELRAYSSNLGLMDVEKYIGNPTGLVVPSGSISYNPLRLTKTVKEPVGYDTTSGKDLPQVTIGAEFTYSIAFDHDVLPLTNISVVDVLPAELVFVRATGDGMFGRYEPQTHTYTWWNPLPWGSATQCLELVCRVDPKTSPGRIIANSVTLNTHEMPPTTTTAEAVAVAAKVYRPLGVTKTVMAGATGGGPGTPASVNAGGEVTYRITFDNKGNNDPVENVRVTDDLPGQMRFVRATDDGLFGRYDSATHTYTWSYPRLAQGESNTVDLVLRLDTNVAGGATITNTVTAESANTPAAKAGVDVKVAGYGPLRLQKTLLSGAVGQPDERGRPRVEAGGIITYGVYFSNPPTNGTATQVAIVDILPREVSFVSADGDREFGSYDPNTHTFTWRYGSLEPGREQRLGLVVRVDENTKPDTVIRNSVVLTTQQTLPTEADLQVVATAAPVNKPLGVTKTVMAGAAGAVAGMPASVNAGDEITYRITFDNRGNTVPAGNVRVTDDLPRQMSLVRATDDRLFGGYDSATHTYTWSYPQLAQGESNTVDLVLRLDPSVAGGATITNAVTAESDNTPAARAAVDIRVVGYAPLRLRKTLLSGAVGEPDEKGRPQVEAGGILTYAICFSNPAPNKAVTDVAITDLLPREVSFVSADGDREFGQYDPGTHAFTWRYASLEPGVEQCVSLAVRVNEKVDPNTVIGNSVTIVSQETTVTRVQADVVVRGVPKPPTEVKGTMYTRPDHIFRNNAAVTPELMVVVHMPEGIGEDAISNASLVLTPGNVRATGQQIFGTSTQGKVLCFFDTAPILAATPGYYGQLRLTVTGKLRDAQSFACETTIWILKFGGP